MSAFAVTAAATGAVAYLLLALAVAALYRRSPLGPAVMLAASLTSAWMGAQGSRLRDPRQEDFGLGLKLSLPPEYLLLHRVWAGGLGVLCQLGGTVAAREMAYEWLPGLADDPPGRH